MTTTILLSSPLFLFFTKMIACGAAGCLILSLVHIVLDLRMNRGGWKSAKDFCHTSPEDFSNVANTEKFYDETDENNRLIPQRVPVRNFQKNK